jgi:hypothetical protein
MRSAILLVLVGCGSSASSSSKGDVSVELSSVTLADDCGDSGNPPPPPAQLAAAGSGKMTDSEKAAAEMVSASCAKGANCNFARSRGCDQTSMQLAIKSGDALGVRIKTVELLDAAGKPLQQLAARTPTKWGANKYEPWDGKLAPGQLAQTSYSLAAPDWNKLGGRMDAQTKKYQLRVVVEVGDSEHTLEKQSISPALMQPDVVTQR